MAATGAVGEEGELLPQARAGFQKAVSRPIEQIQCSRLPSAVQLLKDSLFDLNGQVKENVRIPIFRVQDPHGWAFSLI